MLRRIALAAALTLVAVACGDDDDATSAGSVDDVQALAAQLDGVADGCALEYEGLVDDEREISICTLGDEVAELAVWSDTGALDELASRTDGSGDPLVIGPNWSIDVRDETLADQIAEATGGTVRS